MGSPVQETAGSVSVLPIGGGEGLSGALTYKVPEALNARLTVGQLVRIPLGRRTEMGVVAGTSVGSPAGLPEERLKFILGTVHDLPVLTLDLVALAQWMQRYYGASMQSVLEAMIPVAIRRGVRPQIAREVQIDPSCRPDPADIEALRRKAPRQAEILAFLQQQQRPVARPLLLKRLKATPGSLDALIRKGWVREDAEQVNREAYQDGLGGAERVGGAVIRDLTEDQTGAVKAIFEDLERGGFAVRLIHGVTGSGKTEVYLQALDQVLASGGTALFLVPEIALAPQTVGRLRERLEERGVRTVVWHSHLSEGQRFDAWQAVASGEARVVVGARSAVFAPLPDLRLVVVDEEHEPAYKQEEAPRYHGRDVAVMRAREAGCLCLLGSATPALESLVNVDKGKYRVSRLPRRVDDRKLPTVHVVDMRVELLRDKGRSGISRLLADKLHDRYEKREQSILFLNRRGFANSLLCLDCGWHAESPNSSVSMTYHRTDDTLRCHLSGHAERAPARCPGCGSVHLRKRGLGTQRIEENVSKLLPRARIVRMDTDVMIRKNAFRNILNDFRAGKIDILVGTQMIAKGLDFPNVTLVGLVDADMSMHQPDFRAAERTFQLMVQVAGRAGRGDASGEVVVQTFAPHGGPILFARQNDFEGFLQEELEQRREFNYPPYRHLIRHIFRGRNEEKVRFFIEQWAQEVEKLELPEVEVRGPATAPIEKIKDQYRFHLWYFVPQVSRVLPALLEARQRFPLPRDVQDTIDVDPMQMS
ncbi:MAG: replication restart helicase PriA [Opitutales bacterium]